MLLASLSALVAIACSAASLRRLRWAVAPTALSPALLTEAIAQGGAVACRRLYEVIALDREAGWEHQLLVAFAEGDRRARDALVSEQLTELEGRTAHWARVPRACASIASSAGFFFASVAVLSAAGIAPQSGSNDGVYAALTPALDALAVGIAGTSFCVAIHVRARRALHRWNASADRLVARLELIASQERP